MKRHGRLWIPEAPNLILARGPCPRPTLEALIQQPRALLEGIFSWRLIRRGQTLREGSFRNLITDAGLNGIGNGAASSGIATLISSVGVGTSSVVPTVAQTDLIAPVLRVSRAGTGNNTTSSGPGYVYQAVKKVWLFLEAEANANLTEVGIFSATSGGVMWSRQLIKDSMGVETVITKTVDDQLEISYELRIYPPEDSAPSIVTIAGIDHTIVTRAIRQDAGWGWATDSRSGVLSGLGMWNTSYQSPMAGETNVLGGKTGAAGTGTLTAGSATFAAYAAGTFYRDTTGVWAPSSANFATGVGEVVWASWSSAQAFQTVFTPKINKTATKRLTLVVRLSWGRYP